MAQVRSFKEYVKNRFYNELFESIVDYLEENFESLNISTHSVRRIDSAELLEIEVKHVYIEDLPGMEIAFEVLVEAEIYVSEVDRHNDRFDDKRQWFKVSCTGDLGCGLSDIDINNVAEYDIRSKQNKPLSDSLVPIINKNQLESVATEFLEKYYREALYEPMAIDPDVLTKRMGLTVELKRITEDFSVFGQILLTDYETEFYDKTSSTYVKTQATAGTIFVDPDAYYLRNLGSVNNTIIHECVHWDKHRKAFELERLYNENATQIKCQVVGGIKGNDERTATDWMEWQANALAPRIQMPYSQAKVKAIELIQDYKWQIETNSIIDIMESVIDEMAAFFCVSRLAAKIRMIDLGYEEAIGAFTYIDGRYVKPHGFTKGSIRKDQTFSISLRDAIWISTFSPMLKEKVSSGSYLFVESHFCLNHPKYIKVYKDGNFALTDYARLHMDECCLVFDLKIKANNTYGEQFYTECVLYRDAASGIVFEAHYANENGGNLSHEEMIKSYNQDLLSVVRSLPMSFSGTLDALIKWSEMTQEDLAWESQLSEKTIQRLRNDDPNDVTIETIIQLIIGMRLPPTLSMYLLKSSGKSFMMTEQHIMYQFLMNSCYAKSLDECNAMLEAQNLKKLGKKNRSQEIS